MSRLVLIVLILLVTACGSIDGAQEPARVAPPIRVAADADLQAALDAAPPGSVILLPPGAQYTGNFVLPAHAGGQWTTLTTETRIPERRLTAADSGQLAVLRSPSNRPALTTAPGARRWRIVGIEFAASGHSGGTAIEIGSATATNAAELASEIVLDRLLVRGDPTQGQKRGIALHGSALTLTRSHVSDIKLDGQETQAVHANNGPGPYTLTDNYLEASGVNVMFGGDTPRIRDLVPADIRIEGNTIAKPLAWQREPWDVKNLLELKNARRVVIRGNIFQGNWVSAQAGYAILFSPRNQYGDAPWTIVEDVLFEGNVVKDVSSGINIAGDDSEHSSLRTRQIVIRNNEVIADATQFGGDGRFLMIGRAPQSVVIENNTTITNGPAWIYTYPGGAVATTSGLVVRNNVGQHNEYGFSGEGTAASAVRTLARYYPGAVFEGNVITGGSRGEYPSGTLVPAPSEFSRRTFTGRGVLIPLPR
jgi:hypothetical protein